MDVAAQFREFAGWCRGSAELYERLSHAVLDDPDLLDLAGTVPADRMSPHLLLASVHYLLLRGADHPLSAYYPTVTDDPADPSSGDLAGHFRSFCADNEAAIRDLLRSRRTQTNAVRRCTALYPAVAAVRAVAGEPPALVEVGASAGLNLLWDRYGYEYEFRGPPLPGDGDRTGDGTRVAGVPDGASDRGGGVETGSGEVRDREGNRVRVGRRDSRVQLSTAVRGAVAPPLPADPPAVVDRVGVDLHPLDVTDDADVAWLRALVWPEHDERHALLDRAVAVAREDPPALVTGDAGRVLPDVVADLPDGVPVCVYDTQTVYQMSEPERERLRSTIAEVGTGRELYWLSGEGVADQDHMVLRWSTVEDGDLRRRPLLHYEQHGQWLRWLREG